MPIEYRFTEKEWAKLKYNVKDKSHGYNTDIGMLDRFPDLKREVPELSGKMPAGLDPDLVIKYIIIYYSITSPIAKVGDLIERKKVAAKETGFPMGANERFLEQYEDILFCRYREINTMIVAFIRSFKSTKFSMICACNESLYSKIELLLNSGVEIYEKKTPEEIEKYRGDIFKQAEAMEQSLSKLTLDFLTDESPYLQQDLFSFVEKEGLKLMLSPELRHAARESAIV